MPPSCRRPRRSAGTGGYPGAYPGGYPVKSRPQADECGSAPRSPRPPTPSRRWRGSQGWGREGRAPGGRTATAAQPRARRAVPAVPQGLRPPRASVPPSWCQGPTTVGSARRIPRAVLLHLILRKHRAPTPQMTHGSTSFGTRWRASWPSGCRSGRSGSGSVGRAWSSCAAGSVGPFTCSRSDVVRGPVRSAPGVEPPPWRTAFWSGSGFTTSSWRPSPGTGPGSRTHGAVVTATGGLGSS